MTPVTGMQSNMNISDLTAVLFTAQFFNNNASSNPFGIFGSQMNLGNFNFNSTPAFDFSNLFNFSGMNFNFDFSGVNFSSGAQYTAQSGNCKASSSAKGLDKNFLARVKEIAKKNWL